MLLVEVVYVGRYLIVVHLKFLLVGDIRFVVRHLSLVLILHFTSLL